MNSKMLILYASEHGTTRGFAEVISSCLSAAQPTLGPVTCLPVTEAPGGSELTSFDAIILGSAIHQQAWLPEMTKVLSGHLGSTKSTEAIQSSTLKPRLGVYAFSVGCPAAMGKLFGAKAAIKEERMIREKIEGTLGLRGILKEHTLFQGKMEKSDVPWEKVNAPLGFVIRGLFWMVGGRWGDYRDEKAVEGWANNVLIPGIRKSLD